MWFAWPHFGSRDPPAACGGAHTGDDRYSKEDVSLSEAHTRAGSWQDL